MPEETWLTNSVFIVENLFTADECDRYIRLSEEIGRLFYEHYAGDDIPDGA